MIDFTFVGYVAPRIYDWKLATDVDCNVVYLVVDSFLIEYSFSCRNVTGLVLEKVFAAIILWLCRILYSISPLAFLFLFANEPLGPLLYCLVWHRSQLGLWCLFFWVISAVHLGLGRISLFLWNFLLLYLCVVPSSWWVPKFHANFLDIGFQEGLSIFLISSHSPFLSFLNGECANPVGDEFCFEHFQVILYCEALSVILIAPVEKN